MLLAYNYVFRKSGTLTTETTVLLGPMMLLTRSNGIGLARGIVFFIFLYNGKPNEALDALRYMRFCAKVRLESRFVPEEWS